MSSTPNPLDKAGSTLPNLRVVFVSGPPGCGKDTLGILLCENGASGPWVLDKFDIELRERCHAAHKLFDTRGGPLRWDYFEGQLDVPLTYFENQTPRTAYQAFLSGWVRPICGKDALGRWLTKRVDFYLKEQRDRMPAKDRARNIVITDANPKHPATCRQVVDRHTAENCTVINMTREGDTTEYPRLSLTGVRSVQVHNPGKDTLSLLNAVKEAAPHLFFDIITTDQV